MVYQSLALTLSCLLQPTGVSQLSLHSTFLGSELPLAPLPPEPHDVTPSSLSPQLRHKPTLQYDFPGKCLSLEPPAPHYVSPIPSPQAPLLSLESPFSPTSASCSKFPYSSAPDPSLVTHTASPLSSSCFTPYVPGLRYATGMGPQGYPSPAVSQLLPPTLLGNPRFAHPKGLPQGGGGRPKVKPSGAKARRLPGHPLSHLPEPNPCPSQLLTTGNRVGGLWGDTVVRWEGMLLWGSEWGSHFSLGLGHGILSRAHGGPHSGIVPNPGVKPCLWDHPSFSGLRGKCSPALGLG